MTDGEDKEVKKDIEKIRFRADRINLKANVILAGIVAIITVIAGGLMTSDVENIDDISQINIIGLILGISLLGGLFWHQYIGIKYFPLVGVLLKTSGILDWDEGCSIKKQVNDLKEEINEVYKK